MAERIQELMVELGLESDAKAFREAEGLFNSLRSSALQFGAALGGGLSLQQLTFGFARTKDEMARFAAQAGVSIQLVDELGYAAQRSGGRARDAFSIIQQMNELMDGVTKGDIPGLDDAAFWGMDPRAITEAQDVADLIERIADETARMGDDARRGALGALGLGSIAEHSLFTAGADVIQAYRQEARELSQITGEMVTVSQEFLDEMARMTRLMGRFTNEISTEILPNLTAASQQFRAFLMNNSADIITLMTQGPEGLGAKYGDQAREWLSEHLGQMLDGIEVRGAEGPVSLRDALQSLPSMPQLRPEDVEWLNQLSSILKARPAQMSALDFLVGGGGIGGDDSSPAPRPAPAARLPWSDLSRSGIDLGADTWIPDVHPETLDTIQQMLRNEIPGGIGGDLTPEELYYQPSPTELIPQGNRSELREGNRRQLEHHFPEQYGQVPPAVFNIYGITEPEAVAAAVDRRLSQHAITAARSFTWPEGSA